MEAPVKRNETWSVAEAKARFSEVIDDARARGPQTITRNGKPAVVVVAAAEWERLARPAETLAEFFARSPLRGVDLDLERRRDRPRKVDL
jgi:prevent-host-death family protein